MDMVVPAGFTYKLWLGSSITLWTELPAGPAHTQFYAPTGIPALADGYTLHNVSPRISTEYDKIIMLPMNYILVYVYNCTL